MWGWRRVVLVGLVCAACWPHDVDGAGRRPRKTRKDASTEAVEEIAEKLRVKLGIAAPDPEAGYDANQVALNLAMQDRIGEALEHFEESVAHDPYQGFSFEPLNNLGVTYMRLGKPVEARAAFKAILAAKPEHEIAQDNLDDLDNAANDGFPTEEELAEAGNPGPYSMQEEEDKLKKRGYVSPHLAWRTKGNGETTSGSWLRPLAIEHTVRRLPRISAEALYDPANVAYATLQQPFVLEGQTKMPGWGGSIWDEISLDFLALAAPKAKVDYFGASMERLEKDTFSTRISFAKVVEDMKYRNGDFLRSAKNSNSSYMGWHMPGEAWDTFTNILGPMPNHLVSDSAWLKECMVTNEEVADEMKDALVWHLLVAGNEGSGMYNHYDQLPVSSWQLQLKGRKRWHLCPPDQQHTGVDDITTIDTFRPDYESHKDLLDLDCYLEEVGPGDIIAYPAGWWHQTENLDPESMSLSDSVVDSGNVRNMIGVLQNDCGAERRRPDFSDEGCDMLEEWWAWWEVGLAGPLVARADAAARGELWENLEKEMLPQGVGTLEAEGFCKRARSKE